MLILYTLKLSNLSQTLKKLLVQLLEASVLLQLQLRTQNLESLVLATNPGEPQNLIVTSVLCPGGYQEHPCEALLGSYETSAVNHTALKHAKAETPNP